MIISSGMNLKLSIQKTSNIIYGVILNFGHVMKFKTVYDQIMTSAIGYCGLLKVTFKESTRDLEIKKVKLI